MLKITKDNEATLRLLVKEGANVAKIKGAVHYLNESSERATDKEVIALLGKYGYIAPKRATNFRGNLYELLEDGTLSEADFKELLVDASDNTIVNRKHYDAIRLLCNNVRSNAINDKNAFAKADAKIKDEAKAKGGS